jgi:hypothetical protein
MAFLKQLGPANLKRLANLRLHDLVVREIPRAKKRVGSLQATYPSASPREIAQRLIDAKKSTAGMVGGISGVFGIASVPADLLVVAWLQIVLLVDIATVFRANLKSASTRHQLFQLFGYANGIGPIQRASPMVLGKVVGNIIEKSGLRTVGRALPLIAAPVSAYLNNKHIQTVGEAAIRHYDGFEKARQKNRPPLQPS